VKLCPQIPSFFTNYIEIQNITYVHTWVVHSNDNNNVHMARNGNQRDPRPNVDIGDNSTSIFNNTWKIEEIKASKLLFNCRNHV
jgi:hypothetical protein